MKEEETKQQLFEQHASKPNRDTGTASAGSSTELLSVLARVETLLEQLRGQLDSTARESQHREFSPAKLIGAILQALVLGFFVAALADWIYGAEIGSLLKLAFAAVLQLGALTAFVVAHTNR